jgi:hypothetical protein
MERLKSSINSKARLEQNKSSKIAQTKKNNKKHKLKK